MLDMSNLIPAGAVDQPLWISGGSYTIGQQTVSPADLCVYVRKTNGAGATDPASDTTNWQSIGARAIRSIQRITIAITAAANSNTGAISSVTTAKSKITLLGVSGSGVNGIGAARVELTNSTTVTAYGYETGAAITIGAQVEETY